MSKKYFVYLGCSGFPYGLAEVKKMTLISKSLVLAGNSVTIIGEKGVHSPESYPHLQTSGIHEGIAFIYTSGSPFRNKAFIKRNLLKIKGIWNEFLYLKKIKKNKQLDYAIISSHKFLTVLFYITLSKVFGFKTILNHVEFYSGVKPKMAHLGKWFNNFLYDKYIPRLVDITFPISEFLIDHLRNISPTKKYFKIPVLAEFEKYNGTEILDDPPYFLFSGAAAYLEIISFIINSFCLLDRPFYLYLAIKGDESDLVRLRHLISKNPKKEMIRLFTTLNEKQLYNLYRNAAALLIPLRPTLQDQARFPHKVGEYLASGNPVVSTNYGEIKFYFKDMETMLIADTYNEDSFSEKMKYVTDHTAEAKQIGENGRDLAKKKFDYLLFGEQIGNFLGNHVKSQPPKI